MGPTKRNFLRFSRDGKKRSPRLKADFPNLVGEVREGAPD